MTYRALNPSSGPSPYRGKAGVSLPHEEGFLEGFMAEQMHSSGVKLVPDVP